MTCGISPAYAQVILGTRTDADKITSGEVSRYVNPLVLPDAGRVADPTVIRVDGRYYLYLTGGIGGGKVWSSGDLLTWESHEVELPEEADIAAPDAFAYKGYVYLTGNYSPLYRSRSPLGPFELYGDFRNENGQRLDVDLCKGCRNGGVFDAHVFVDEDERLYLFYSGRTVNGIYGVELDGDNPTKFLGPVRHFFTFEPSHTWERYGNYNEFSNVSWMEGPWMTKRNGTYYLQYVAPGTDIKTYAVGVYTSKSPLGPFKYYEGSPILVHRRGLINGTGHHSVVEGPEGTMWAIYTLLYRNWNRMFERRVGMDPVGFDTAGNMFISGPSETPQFAPGVRVDPAVGNDSGALPLSEDKSYTVSSEAPGRNAPYAFDGNARTWWAPAEDDAEASLTLDLGWVTDADPLQEFMVDSARILFMLPQGLRRAGEGARTRQYTIAVSRDGKEFATVVDHTENAVDNAVTFDEITPVRCRYVRLTITGWPAGMERGVIEFTVFGEPVGN